MSMSSGAPARNHSGDDLDSNIFPSLTKSRTHSHSSAVSSVEITSGAASPFSGCTFPLTNVGESFPQSDLGNNPVADELPSTFVRDFGRVIVVSTCAVHIVSLVLCLFEGERFWATGLALLFGFDVCAGCCYLKGAKCSFFQRSFDRGIVSVISAIIMFYAFFDKYSSIVRSSIRFVLYAAGWVSVLSIAFSAVEIDASIHEEVARNLKSRFATFKLVAMRTFEAASRVSIWILLCMVVRPWLQLKIPVSRHSNLVCSGIMLCMFGAIVMVYTLSIFLFCSGAGQPKENFTACLILGVMNLAVNPLTWLFNNVWFSEPARKVVSTFRLFRIIEVLVTAFFVFSTYSVRVERENAPPYQIGLEIVTDWKLMCQVTFTLWAEAFFSFANSRLCGGPFSFRSNHNNATGIPFLPGAGSRWDVQGVPEMPMATFLVSHGTARTGIVAYFVPMNPVNTTFFVVERLLGQGGYGVVVKVRQEGRAGQQPKYYALKLQHTASSKERNVRRGFRSQREMAMREREVYRRIWEQYDPETGRLGHPFIVKLVCYSDWPQEKQLLYESNNEPVEFYKNGVAIDRFDSALLMEFCAEGSLESYLPQNMRRSVHDRDMESSIQWLYRARLFIGEILIALDFLHNTKSVIYRDLKPDNVFIAQDHNGDPHVKLGDFGFSKVVTAMDKPVSIAGTHYFCAPEIVDMIARNRSGTTDWSLDTYSLGMLIFVLFYGAAHDRRHDKWVMAHHMRLDPLPTALHELAKLPRCPESVVALVEGSIRKEPTERLSVEQMKKNPLFDEVSLGSGAGLHKFPWAGLRAGRF